MTKQDFLEPALTSLAKLQIDLDKKGGPSEDGELFEKVLSVQDGILKSFGLPISPNYEELVWFKSVPTTNELKERVSRLYSAATRYLLSDAKSDIQILREAQENQSDPFYVLPELKITTHTYTIFVFNKILLKGKDSVENVLHDLRFCNQPEILDALGQIHFGRIDNDHEIDELLEAVGVKYLQQFIIYNSNLLDDDAY
jgi:hypothetical protein